MMSNNHQALAQQAVKDTRDIQDFAYHGDLDIGRTWAFTFSRHRDSDALANSNFKTIQADLEKRFPNSVEVVHTSHWAVGWLDHLAVKMLDKRGRVTKAGIAALEWKAQLDDYPVADEEDLSEREWEEAVETVHSIGGETDDAPDDWAEQFLREASVISPESIRAKDVEEFLREKGWSEKRQEEEEEEEEDVESDRNRTRAALVARYRPTTGRAAEWYADNVLHYIDNEDPDAVAEAGGHLPDSRLLHQAEEWLARAGYAQSAARYR